MNFKSLRGRAETSDVREAAGPRVGAAPGRAAGQDFRSFAGSVDALAGGGWDGARGEPPKTRPAHDPRSRKSCSRAGGRMRHAPRDNPAFIRNLPAEPETP